MINERNLNEQELNNKILNATKWSAITEILAKLINPLTNMVLARIVLPESFGVIATITMVISFADIFTDAGFQKYLVQQEFIDKKDLYDKANVAFWTNFFISIVLWVNIIVFRHDIAYIVGNPGLGNVIAIACVQLLLTSFSSVQTALYRRDFNFKTLFIVRSISICIPLFVTVPLALMGLQYWALIIGNIIINVSNSIFLTLKSPWKPYLFYRFNILKQMISFSAWTLVESISIWLTGWVDVLIIGRILSEYYLGIYKTSTTIANSLISLVTAIIVPVFFSALSRLKLHEAKFNQYYFTTQRITTMLLLPIGVGIYIYSDLATKILLGNKWLIASQIIGVWALTSVIKFIFCSLSSEVYRAKGLPKLSFLAQILHLIVLIPTLIYFSNYDFMILVNVRAWIRMQFVLVHFILMIVVLKIPMWRTFSNIFPAIIATSCLVVLALILRNIYDGILWNLTSILSCALAYFGILYAIPISRNDLKYIFYKILRNKESYE